MGNPLAKVALPLVVIAIIYVRFGRRRDADEVLGLRPAKAQWVLLWVALMLAYMLVTNYFMYWRGPWDFEPWRRKSLYANVLRFIAIVFFGPISEELIFRGVLFWLLSKIMPVAAVVVVTAIAFALMHMNYSYGIRAMFVGYAVLLGAARAQTRSIITPIVMHIAWNAYAIW